jgi:MoxR-like ATPase
MSSAVAAPVARGTVTDALVRKHRDIFDREAGFLAKYNVEREEQIELLGLSLISGIDPLFLGDPGVGKTWMIELMLALLDGATDEDFFNTLVFKETPADDILGMRSLPAMKVGKVERIMDGYLPTAVVAYLDEIFKASPTLVNSLLDIMANRKLKVGRTKHDVSQLLCVFASSNELPDREDMLPFRDRFGLTNFVPPVRTPEGRKQVMTIQDEYQAGGGRIDLTDAPRLTLTDVAVIREEVRHIIVPDVVKESLASAMDKWEQKGFLPSMRRQGQMILGMKSRAWSRGEGSVTNDDFIILQHMAWNHPDHAKNAHEVVMEFANVFARKAARMREALDPVLSEITNLKSDIANSGGELSNEHDERAFKIMRDLRRLRKDTREQIEEGQHQGHDVKDLERVLSEVQNAHGWVEKKMTGEDDDA